MAQRNQKPEQKPAAENRRARRDYEIERTLEAGLVLTGSEVKSLRLQRADLTQAWAGGQSGELFLFQADIPAYTHAVGRNHAPKRRRKLLVHKKERVRLFAALQQKGQTLVPLKLYFNARGRAKLLLGLGRGRRQADKRAREKTRDWQREKERLLRRQPEALSKSPTKKAGKSPGA